MRKTGYFRQTISLQIFYSCLPQILLGPFLNTLSQMIVQVLKSNPESFATEIFLWIFTVKSEIFSKSRLPSNSFYCLFCLKRKNNYENIINNIKLKCWFFRVYFLTKRNSYTGFFHLYDRTFKENNYVLMWYL